LIIPILLLLILAACTSQKGETPLESSEDGVEISETTKPEVEERETVTLSRILLDNPRPPAGAEGEFDTDFSISTVPFDEI
jgi:hypothetical protein